MRNVGVLMNIVVAAMAFIRIEVLRHLNSQQTAIIVHGFNKIVLTLHPGAMPIGLLAKIIAHCFVYTVLLELRLDPHLTTPKTTAVHAVRERKLKKKVDSYGKGT